MSYKVYRVNGEAFDVVPEDEKEFLERNPNAELVGVSKGGAKVSLETGEITPPGKSKGARPPQSNQQENTESKSGSGSSESNITFEPKQYKVGEELFNVNSKEEEDDLLKTHKAAKLIEEEEKGWFSKAFDWTTQGIKEATKGAIAGQVVAGPSGGVAGAVIGGAKHIIGKEKLDELGEEGVEAMNKVSDYFFPEDEEGETFEHQLPDNFEHASNEDFEAAAGGEGWQQEEKLTKWFNEESIYKNTNIRMAQAKRGREAVEILIGDQKEGQGRVFDLTKGYGATISEGLVMGAFNRQDGVWSDIKYYIDEATNRSYSEENLDFLKDFIEIEDLTLDATNENIARFITHVERKSDLLEKYGTTDKEEIKKIREDSGESPEEIYTSDVFGGQYIYDNDGNPIGPLPVGATPPPPYPGRLDRKWYMSGKYHPPAGYLLSLGPMALGIDEYNVDMSGTTFIPDGKGGKREVSYKYLWEIRNNILKAKKEDLNEQELETKLSADWNITKDEDGIDEHLEKNAVIYFGYEDQRIKAINDEIGNIESGKITKNGKLVDIDDQDAADETLERIKAERAKIIEEKGYDNLYDENGNFIGINQEQWVEDEKDPNFLVNVETGERIPNIDPEAQQLADDHDLDWLTSKRREAYINLVTLAKIAHAASGTIDAETNAIIKGFGDWFDPNDDSLDNDLRQLALVAETGDIFHLMGKDGLDLPYLTDLPGKSQIARDFNQALLDFKTLSRAVDLNVNLLTTKKEGFWKQTIDDLGKSFFGGAILGDNVDEDDFYDSFSAQLKQSGYTWNPEAAPEGTAKWYEISKNWEEISENWSHRGNNTRDILDLASSTVTSIGPLAVELIAMSRTGASGGIARSVSRAALTLEKQMAKMFPKLAARFTQGSRSLMYKNIIRDSTIGGVSTMGTWSIGETVGKSLMGWDAQTINYDPETGKIETRLMFPFAMGFAGTLTAKANQAMFESFMKNSIHAPVVSGWLKSAQLSAPRTTNIATGTVGAIQQGGVATVLLTVSEAAQLISNDIANGVYWPGGWPPKDSPEGQARLEEWKHLTDRDHLISTWIAMTVLPVLEGKVHPKIRQNITRDILALKDNTVLSKQATEGLKMESKYETNPDGSWETKDIKKAVHDKIIEIKRDKNLSREEMIDKIKKAEQWGRELFSRNNVIASKNSAIAKGEYNEYLRDQFLLANKIPTGNLSGDELTRLSELREHEFEMFLRNEGIEVGSGTETFYKQVYKTIWNKRIEADSKAIKGKQLNDYLLKHYELAKNNGTIDAAKEVIKEDPSKKQSLEGEIKVVKDRNKVLETELKEIEKKAEKEFKEKKKNQNAADKKAAEPLDKTYERVDGRGKKGQKRWEDIAKREKADKDAEAFYSADGKRIYINSHKTNQRKTLGAGTHELTHAVLWNHLKETVKDPITGKQRRVVSKEGVNIIDHMLSDLSGRERRHLREIVEPVHNPDGKRNKQEYYEEYVTTLAHEIKDGNIKRSVGLGRKLGRTLFPYIKKVYPNMYKFNLNQTNSKQAAKDLLRMVETIGTEGVTPEIVALAKSHGMKPTGRVAGEVKKSVRDFEKFTMKDGKRKYNTKEEFWASEDVGKAHDMITNSSKLNNLIETDMRGLGVPEGFAMNDFVRKVKEELGERFMKNYDPAKNDNLFGWLTGVSGGQGKSIIYRAKGDVINKWKKEQGISGLSLDAPIGEKGTRKDLLEGEIDSAFEKLETEIIGVEQTQKTSKLRKSLGLEKDMMEIVRQSVIRTIGRNQTVKGEMLPGVDNKLFKEELQKAFRAELKKPIQDMIGSRENYNKFLIEHFEGVFDALPVETLVQMERDIGGKKDMKNYPNAKRIFTTSRRITSPIEVRELRGEGKLPIDVSETSGPQLHTKNKYPGTSKVLAYFRGSEMFKQLGYERGGSTLGTRKDKLAMEIGVELAFDATMEVLQRPEIAKKRSQILELREIEQLENEMAIIAKQINRDPNVQFSKRKNVNKAFEKAMKIDGVTKGEIINVFANRDIEFIKDNMPLTYDALRVSYESKYGPQEYKNKNFTDQVAEFGGELKDIIKAKSYQTTGKKKGIKWWDTKLIDGMLTHFSGATKKAGAANMLDFMPIKFGAWETQMRLNKKGAYKFSENDLLKSNSSPRGNALKLVNGKPVYNKLIKAYRNRLEKGDMGKFLVRYPELQKKWDLAMKAIENLQLAESTIKYEGTLTKELTELMRNENLSQPKKLELAKKKFNPKSVDAAFKLYDAYMSSHQAWFNHKVNVEKMSKKEAITYVITSMQSNANFTKGLRALAPVTAVYFPKGKKRGVILHLKGEHILDSATFSAKLVDAIYNNTFNQNAKSLYTNFRQALIPSKFAKKMDKLGGANSPLGNRRFLLMPEFGKQVFDLQSGKSMYELELAKFAKETSEMLRESWVNSKKTNTHRKAGETIDVYAKSSKRRGMSTFDFDDTMAYTKSGVRTRVPSTDGLPKPNKKVIFMAGGAGSGKGNVVNKLKLEKQGFKIVNQDISLEWLKKNHGLPENMRDFTKEQKSTLGKLGHQARGIAKRKMMKFQGKGDGVVIDGTGGSAKMMEKLVNEFKDKGYDVSMMFVETTLKTALARNRARQERSLLDFIVRKNHEAVQGNKPIFKKMFGERFMEIKTDKLTMDSPMPKKLVSKMNDFISSYEKIRLDAAEFASKGDALLKKGAKFDFSEFNKVVEGTEGPYLKTAIERAKKFGTKDMFVLTARPKESAKAIHEFLKSQGLNIPLKNITGLANSTGNAKAKWMLEKFAEGYNDMYFVDDAMKNVEAVKEVLDQLDIKSKVVQAKAQSSKRINREFNKILERASDIKAGRIISGSEGQLLGGKRGGKLKDLIIPPSAQDLRGLMMKLYGKGKQGDADMKFIKETLFDPFARGIRDLTITKQKMSEEYKTLRNQSKDVKKSLNKNIEGTPYTVDHAVRVYLWEKAGHKVPDISDVQKQRLVDYVKNRPELITFAETLQGITRFEKYLKPGEYWAVESIASDLNKITRGATRKQHLKEWKKNKDIIFSKENLNKLEAIYGKGYREALENMLYRMEHGTNRLVGTKDGPVKWFYDWVNGSVGATMFWNTRSAVLQTISTVNFINHKENNIFKVAAAFANQPQFWKDFAFIFNSPMLKQRRAGLEIDVSASELTNQFQRSGKNPKAILNYMLQQGFTPTRVADSFAIAMGGASYYRNRFKMYIKQGLSQKEAKKKAWLDFQEIAEETQQSSRPDLISQQQAGPLGRIILAWQNTPMQMTRLMHKAVSNLVNNRGSKRENISRILYYGAMQNLWFMALQSGLGWLMFGSDQEEAIEKKELRVVNGALDTLLRGTGIYGAALATLKNTALQYIAESKSPKWKRDYGNVVVEAINLSPPIGSKIRKMWNAMKTWDYNEGVSKEIGFRIENPDLLATSNIIEAITNVPMARIVNKANNLEEAITGNHETWQRIAMMLGWSRWNVGVKDEELEEAKDSAKENRKEENKKEKEKKEKENLESGKVVRCSGIKSNGQRCGLTTSYSRREQQAFKDSGKKTWTCPHHSEFKDGSDRDGDGVKEYQCTGTTSSGKRCKNKGEYGKKKRCYAHQ